MGYNKEMARNLVLLKKCRRIHSTTFYIFLVGGIMFIIYAFLNSAIFAWEWLYAKTSITSPSGVVIAVIIDALIVAPLAFFFAYRASIKLRFMCCMGNYIRNCKSDFNDISEIRWLFQAS